jgi:dolichol-phosphate mannosyltransferase
MVKTKYLVIVPTYNEVGNIVDFLTQLDRARLHMSNAYTVDILVVDDESPDGTLRVAESLALENFFSLSNPHKAGLGHAYVQGFIWGLSRGYDYFVEMDADLSHDPSQLPELIAESGATNIVIGTRWMPGGSVLNWPLHRRAISRIGTWYADKALRLSARDLTSGYRVLPKELIQKLDFSAIESKGYSFQIEIAARAIRGGFALVEVPITFTERRAGKSKMSPQIALEAVLKVTSWALRGHFRA